MAAKTTSHHYENNPFFIASSGITLLANTAGGVFVLRSFYLLLVFLVDHLFLILTKVILTVLSLLSVHGVQEIGPRTWFRFCHNPRISDDHGTSGRRVSAYTSARLARGKKSSLPRSLRPGIRASLGLSMAPNHYLCESRLMVSPPHRSGYHYGRSLPTLAGVAFYDDKKNLRGNAAVKKAYASHAALGSPPMLLLHSLAFDTRCPD